MVKDKDYLKLFSHGAEDTLTEAELSEIIDEELSKSEEEMDTELIESCLDAINRLKNDTQKGVGTNVQVKKFRLHRWAAAAVAVVLVAALSVLLVVRKPERDVLNSEFYSLAEENGYGSVNLPAAMLTDECEVVSVKAQEATERKSFADSTRETKVIVVSFVYKEKNCKLTVEKQRRPVKGEKIEVPELSGINVKLYYADGEYIAEYKDGENYYTVQMPVSLPEVRKFLRTLNRRIYD